MGQSHGIDVTTEN